jgi:predicted glycosyltransferase
MMGCMDAADLVVAMGGYNTACEILTQKKRAIIVPRVKPVQEQCIRAERMSRLGLLRAIHPDALHCAGLMRAVQEELSRINVHPRGMYQIDLDGMTRISESIGELLYDAVPCKRAATIEQRAFS